VDGSDTSLGALDLAIAEATLRGCPVRAVYADPWAQHPAWANLPPDPLSESQQAIKLVGRRATVAAVPVTAEVVTGDPGPALVRESDNAVALFVGHRGRGGFRELLLGSVAIKVAAHARCPVFVTRGSPGAASASDRTIVVGVDGTPANQTAIGFAFAEADLRAARLHGVHVWTGPDVFLYDPAADRRARETLVDESLTPWTRRFPSVAVSREVVAGRPAHALIDLSQRAQLVVVGSHTPGMLPGIRLGTISHTLLHHAFCPVAVTR
jgi:nucleotide-binding universal stress UspA family protein